MLGALALVGPACPTQLRVFLLTLSIADDVVAVSVIGVFYSESIDLVASAVAASRASSLIALLSRLAGVAGVGLRRRRRSCCGSPTVESGLHPTIAGMAAGLLISACAAAPRARSSARDVAVPRVPPVAAAQRRRSARLGLVRAVSLNERLQAMLHPWTSYVIVPLFALANAGVDLRGGVLADALSSPVTWGVVVGLVVGKLVGIGARRRSAPCGSGWARCRGASGPARCSAARRSRASASRSRC